MGRARPWLLGGAAAGAIALLCYAVIGRPSLSSDVIHALIWGRDLFDGRMPAYAEGPTPHPLPNLLSGGLSVLGVDGAYHASEVLALLFFGGLLVCIAALGRALFSLPVGILAAALIGTQYHFLSRAFGGFFDVPAVALAAGALVAVLTTQRFVLAAVLLALAGLIRPEYWLFAAVLGTWALFSRTGRERALIVGTCAAAPAVWMLTDGIVTGNPLWSLTHTQDLAAELGRRTGLAEAPSAFVEQLRKLVSSYVLLLAPLGAFLAFQARRKACLTCLAIVAAGAATYGAIGTAGLSLIDRYLLPSAIALALLGSYAAVGWVTDRDRLIRPACFVIAGLSALILLSTVPTRLREGRALRVTAQERTAIMDDLRTVAAARDACDPVHVTFKRGILRPTVAHVRNLTPADIRVLDEDSSAGTFITPGDGSTARAVRGLPTDPVDVPATRGRLILATTHWRLTRAEACAASAGEATDVTRLAHGARSAARPRAAGR